MITQTSIQTVAESFVAKPIHAGVSLSLYSGKSGQTYEAGAGNLTSRTPYFGTGTTKLFISTIVLQLVDEGRIELDAPFKTYMPNCRHCVEVHVKNGVDYTNRITVRHLLGHRSGLGDFFIYDDKAGVNRKMRHQATSGVDSAWTFEDVIARARSHGAVAPPGSGKSIYADTNYHILGKLIETIESASIAEVVAERIAKPLGLSSTYIYCDPSDKRPVNPLSDLDQVDVPRTFASFQADGGLVTTSHDSMIFARALVGKKLISSARLIEMQEFEKAGFPLEVGLGIQRIIIPWWRCIPARLAANEHRGLWRSAPKVVGYFGLGGAFCLYAYEDDVYCAGTANQMSDVMHGANLALSAIDSVCINEQRDGVVDMTKLAIQ